MFFCSLFVLRKIINIPKKKKTPTLIWPGLILVETAGQLIRIFQCGLDYSFTCQVAAGEGVL